jgi:adenosylmethionine-8-amino-7-oxononanoate aminotransferase
MGPEAVGHGFTYSGHPVPAAVGLAALELYEGGLIENGRQMGQRLLGGLQDLAPHPLVGDVRGRGMLAALELVTDKVAKTPLPAASAPSQRLFDRAWEAGLIIRAFGNGVLGFAPPLCCTNEDIDQIIDRTRHVLDLTLEDPDIRAVMRG